MLGPITLLIVSIAISFGLSELFARNQPEWFESGYIPSRDERLIYELLPGYRMRVHGARINSTGMNDREFALKKADGVRRIAVVGDSTSFGYLLSQEASFPKVLEGLLRTSGWTRWEVLNFSVPGYNLSQERRLIETKVMRYHPDLVLLVYCGNDMSLPNFLRPRIHLGNFWLHHSYLLHTLALSIDQWTRLPSSAPYRAGWTAFKDRVLGMYYPSQGIFPTPGLEESLYIGGNPPSRDEDVPPALRYMTGPHHYEANLAAVRDFLGARGITFVSMGVMDGFWLATQQKLRIEHVIKGLKSAYQLRQEGRDPGELLLPDEGHLTKEGHRVAARLVLDYLFARGLLER